MSPTKITLIVLFVAVAIGNYVLSLENFKFLLLFAGVVLAFLIFKAHEFAVWKARQEGRDER